MSALFRFFISVLSFYCCVPVALAFTYSFGALSECDNVALSWNGGSPPFQLLIVPVFGTPVNISIPSSAFSNGAGSYSFQLPVANGSQVVFLMSDATGFNSGGSTDILMVGPSKGSSCNTNTTVDFSFQLNSALQQCRPYIFSGYDGAVQPVTINAIIPGGTAFTLNPPTGPTSFTWNANVARGTSMIFLMTDSRGRQGGSSDVKVVGSSDDNTCLNANSPTSTGSPPTPSATLSTTPSSGSSPSSPASPSHSGVSIAAVAGTVIGALLFLAVVITLGLFFLRKRQDARHRSSYRRQSRLGGPGIDPPYHPPTDVPPPTYPMAPLTGTAPYTSYPHSSSTVATASNPFLDAPPSQYDNRSQYSMPYQPSESSYQTMERYQPTQYQPSEASYQTRDAYQLPSQVQLYPPRQPFPPPDPFNASSPPMVPGAEFEPLATQSRGESSSSRDSMTPSQRKAAMAANATRYNPPTRFILHTDVEDAVPPDEDGIVELPPQYSERRGPQETFDPNLPPPGAGHHANSTTPYPS